MFARVLLLSGMLLAAGVPGSAREGVAKESAMWKAGVAKALITPEGPAWLAGYGSARPGQGKRHDLWVKALALEDARGRRAVLVTSDLVGFSKGMYESLCAELRKRYGLARHQVMLTATHNHCAPVTSDCLPDYYPLDADAWAKVAEYSRWLEPRIVQAVGDAFSRLAPATLSAGEGVCTFAVNRRNNKEADVPAMLAEGRTPIGPVDHSVPVLAVRSAGGETLAVVFGYACHPTTLSDQMWCGDYPGYAQIAVERAHPGAMALFWTGCGGDQNPLPRRQPELAEKYGSLLAEGVEQALAQPLRLLAPELHTASESVPLQFQRHATREELQRDAADTSVRGRWARRMLALLDAGREQPRGCDYGVQAWRLGGQLLIALGAEAVVDYSLRFKREYGPGTWVCGYAHDMAAYVPSRRVWEEGGYEAEFLYEYGWLAYRWEPDVEERIAASVHRLARRVSAPADGLQAGSGRTGRLTLRRRELLKVGSPLMHAAYLHPTGIEMISRSAYSSDNGRTWVPRVPLPGFDQGLPHGYRREPAPPFVDPVNGKVLRVVLAMDTPGLDPKIVEPPVALEAYYLRYRVSTDGGKSYLNDDVIVQKGHTPENPFEGVWTGKNGIFLGDVGSQPIRTRKGRILVPAQACVLGPDGKLASPGGGFTYTDVIMLIGRWVKGDRLEWEISERIQGDPARSTRGVIEPTLAEMPDGRILCVMRGSNGGSKDRECRLPSHKWYSVSSDGGYHWSKPEPWSYTDGTPFHSPSSMSQLLTHSSGRCYWIGNLSPSNCRANDPRWPLVIGEVDTQSLLLKKESVLVLDTKQPEEPGINLSHWWAFEDRETGDIVVAGSRHSIGYKAHQPYLCAVGVE